MLIKNKLVHLYFNITLPESKWLYNCKLLYGLINKKLKKCVYFSDKSSTFRIRQLTLLPLNVHVLE